MANPEAAAFVVPKTIEENLPPETRRNLSEKIKKLLKKKNAVIVAHYYTAPEIQRLADETGGHVSDSLDMAHFGHQSSASTLIVCGVRFMGETAKILNPEKRVLIPDIHATCSLDLGCPADEFARFCDAHPKRTVVVYANTSAAVKARADWMVTSGSASAVVRYLKEKGEKIIWAPDKHLGHYIQQQTKADMLLWQGACIVHEEFKGHELVALKKNTPDAEILVHPESPDSVIVQADCVGSTSRLIQYAQSSKAKRFIVATDRGIFYKMQQAAPGKELIEAPTAGHSATCKSCGHCPWMAMNSLTKLLNTLALGANEISLPKEIIKKAKTPIQRLLNYSAPRTIYSNSDA